MRLLQGLVKHSIQAVKISIEDPHPHSIFISLIGDIGFDRPHGMMLKVPWGFVVFIMEKEPPRQDKSAEGMGDDYL